MREFVDIETLPCGCTITRVIIDGTNTIEYAPCIMSCRNYINAVSLGLEKDKQIMKKEK